MNIYEGPVFTIGQFAAMHGINKKTLMWYDEIGLLKPAFVRANGYRCYTYKQSGMLETILMLRALHMPLSDIAAFMADRSAPALASLLTDKLAEVDEMIRYLEELRTVMEKRRAEMRQLCVIDVDAIAVVEEPADQYHLTVETSPDLTLAQGAVQVTAAIQAHQLTARRALSARLLSGPVGRPGGTLSGHARLRRRTWACPCRRCVRERHQRCHRRIDGRGHHPDRDRCGRKIKRKRYWPNRQNTVASVLHFRSAHFTWHQ